MERTDTRKLEGTLDEINQHNAGKIELNATPSPSLILLDFDGTVIECPEGTYVNKIEDVTFIKGALKAIATLQLDHKVGIITNKGGNIEHGMTWKDIESIALFTKSHINRIHEKHGRCKQDLPFYVCDHPVTAQCGCRKPESGLIYMALGHMSFNPNGVIWIVGDHYTDILTAKRCGLPNVRTALVKTGRGNNKETVDFFKRQKGLAPTRTDDTLWDFAKHLMGDRLDDKD